MAGSSIIQVGVTAINAAQVGMRTVGHNIANVNTPGYTRQIVAQKANSAEYSGGGFIGKGVAVSSVQRQYDAFLVAQARDAGSQAGLSSAYAAELARLTNLLGDETTGLSPYISRFFGSIQELSLDPSNVASRNNLIGTANALAQRTQEIDTQLAQAADQINLGITTSVNQVNSLLDQIAQLNDQIALNNATGQPPNDALDQRDLAISDLAKIMRVNTVEQSDGTANVYLANGQAVVVASKNYKLSVQTDSLDPTRLLVGFGTSSGFKALPAETMTGGSLAGYMKYRDGELTSARSQLGRIAVALSDAINAQHKLGQDLNGALGGNLFSVGTPTVGAAGTNTGSGLVAAAVVDSTVLAASDYELSYDGTNYSVRRNSDGTTQTFGSLPQTVDGVQLSVSGSPAAGDRWLVQPTRFASGSFRALISDPAKIAIASPVVSAAPVANLGDATISAPTVNGPTANLNLQQPVTITFTGAGTFNVTGTGTGNPVGVAYSSGASISYNGWTVKIEGNPRAGDSFTIGPNIGGTNDNRNALALSALQTQKFVNGASPNTAYSSIVSNIAVAAKNLKVTDDANQTMVRLTSDARESLSGVNLDEEAADLLRYQQAYQAAVKYVQVASTVFEDLLGIGGR